MKYTDIVWDFDGTLVDTYPWFTRIYQETLKEFGYVVPGEEIRAKLLISAECANVFYNETYGIDLDRLGKRYGDLKKENGLCVDEMKVYPGVELVLKTIKERGGRNYLYTNRDRSALQYLEAYGLLQYFDGFVTAENVKKLKPAPEGMYILFEQYGITPERMLMIGDRELDVDAAKAVGADACFYNTNGIEIPENADYAVETLEDLLLLV